MNIYERNREIAIARRIRNITYLESERDLAQKAEVSLLKYGDLSRMWNKDRIEWKKVKLKYSF